MLPSMRSSKENSGETEMRKTASTGGVPSWLRSYVLAIAALILTAIPTYFVQQSPPPHNAVVGGVLVTGMLVLILGSAWLGYGPGLLICALLCFAVPQVIPN